MTDKKQEFFNTIEQYTTHWDRNSKNMLVLWFSGYKPQDGYDCEEALNKLGGFAVSYDFDKICGKSALIVREPWNRSSLKETK